MTDSERPVCAHLDQIEVTELPPEVAGCEECLRDRGSWLHLRLCLTCSHVGCCDDSPSRHATKHREQTDHPIISSLQPGEEWSYCFIEQVGFVLDLPGTGRGAAVLQGPSSAARPSDAASSRRG